MVKPKTVTARESQQTDEIKAAGNLEELLDILINNADAIEENQYDLTSLPTFGGAEPDDTTGVWSWDAENLLVGEGSISEWEIVNRADALHIV